MNFLLSIYIYPLEEPILLSRKLGIYLDNPRTKEEIDYVSRYIKVSLDSPERMYKYDRSGRLPMSSKGGNILSIKGAFKQFYNENKKTDEYLKYFFKENSRKNGSEFLSKMWIIIRFDDEGTFDEMKKDYSRMQAEGIPGVMFLDSEHPIYKNSERLVDYAYLLSILIKPKSDERAFSSSILLHSSIDELSTPKIDRKLNGIILYWAIGLFPYSEKGTDNDNNWQYYRVSKNSIIYAAQAIEKILDEKSLEKILYVGSLLKVSSEKIEDNRFQLVTLVTIIETLLTRNPDTSRFNVEDSISKQFKLKAGVLLYKDNNNLDLEEMKKNLSDIYSQRSNISHGNFVAYKKFLDRKAKMYTGDTFMFTAKELATSNFIENVYSYVKVILHEYIKDRNFVEFLKES